MVKPVLLIRADNNQADEDALAKLGIPSLIDPYIDISRATDPTSGANLLSQLTNAEAPLWLVATSMNALRFWGAIVGEDQLRAAITARSDLKFAAIGEATAEAIGTFGAHDIFIPSKATGRSLGEELAANFPTGHALIPGGNLAMKTLPSILTTSGWKVSTAVVYTTSPVDVEPNSVRLVRDKEVGAILFRSPSAVSALTHFLPNPAIPLVCAGLTTAQTLEERGLKADAVASSPSAEVVASTIYSLLCQENI